MSLKIQRDQNQFLYLQVIGMIRQMQQSNTLRPGDRLPSLRGLSERLSVSVPTVKQAYGELERQGLIEARPKSGYFLMPVAHAMVAPKRVKLAKRPLSVRRQSLIEEVYEAISKPDVVPLGVANPTAAYPSDKALGRLMRRAISKAGAKAISYGPINGYAPLKRQLALRYLNFGLQVSPEEILITNGAQEALAIALQCVASKGDVIAVESPSYFGVLELIESLGMMALEIPLCPDQGIWMEDLEKAVAEHPIKACIFSSSISNPLGSVTSDQTSQAIVKLLEENDIPLIEDDVYGDLYFTDRRGGLAQLYSKKGLVISCSSFSKTAAPGYRIGWMIAGKHIEAAYRFKRSFSCSSSLLHQWTLADFLATGEYDRKVAKLRHALRVNKERMIAAVRAAFPANTKVSDPNGGCVLWLELPVGNDSEALFHAAMQHNISISPGALFSPSDKFKRCIRISYGVAWTNEIEQAIRTLGSLCHS